MKLLDIIKDANSNLWRNKTRSALTILAIFVGSFAIILTSSIQAGTNKFTEEQFSAFGGEDSIIIYASDENLMSVQVNTGLGTNEITEYNDNPTSDNMMRALTEEDLETVKNIEGIKAEETVFDKSPSLSYIESDKNDKRYNINVAFLQYGNFTIPLESGELINNDSEEYQINLDSTFVEALGFENAEDAIGKTITLAYVDNNSDDRETTTFEAKIVGIIARGIANSGTSYVNNSLADDIYAVNQASLPAFMRDVYYMITATYDPETHNIDDIKERLEKAGYAAITSEDQMQMMLEVFNIIFTVINIFGVVALITAAIGIINTLYMSVQERTREIGLNKALGMSNARVFLSFSLEAILLGFWGSLLGILASIAAGNALNNWAHSEDGFLEGFPTFTLAEFPIENLISITLLIMFIAFLAGTLPARRASKKDPIEALRYE